MNSAGRAARYLSRKKGKTAVLFLLSLGTAVFLVTGFALLHVSEKLSERIRASVGASFSIRAGMDVSVYEEGGTDVTENRIRISRAEIDEIMGMGEIRYCNPVNYGFAKGEKADGGQILFIPGEKYSEESNMGKVTALRFSALAPDFADGSAGLWEGESITEGDTGKILISEELAELNGLFVGDHITLTHAAPGERDGAYTDEIPVKTAFAGVEVSGIYRRSGGDPSRSPTAGVPGNEIYASLDVLEELQESEAGVYTGEIDFYVMDPAKLEELVRKIRTIPSIDWSTHLIRTNDFAYSRIAERLSSLGDLVKRLLLCISAVSTAVLALLLVMRMRGRVREAGILLAAGISKGQILGQLLLEVLSVTAAALVFSCLLSSAAARFMGELLFGKLELHLIGGESPEAAAGGGLLAAGPGGMEVFLVFLCQFMVTAASVCLSSLGIMRRKPKELLSKMS